MSVALCGLAAFKARNNDVPRWTMAALATVGTFAAAAFIAYNEGVSFFQG